MHPAALQWAKLNVPELPARVLDIGGADINCSLRPLYTWSDYTCVDIAPGPDVTVVADFLEWAAGQPTGHGKAGHSGSGPDLVVCFEVFEHTPRWAEMVGEAMRLLQPGGLFVGTCAAPARTPHSAWGDPHPRDGEWYRNVPPGEMAGVLAAHSLEFTVDVARSGLDLRWKAVAR